MSFVEILLSLLRRIPFAQIGHRADIAFRVAGHADAFAELDEPEMAVAVGEVVAESGATSLKDMGGVMGLLKERYGGRMDFAKAAGHVKSWLSR